MVIFKGKKKKDCGLNNCTIDYCIEFQLLYGTITILYVFYKYLQVVYYMQCMIRTEKWDGEKWINISKISFAPKDFYSVLNRHVKKKKGEEEHRRRNGGEKYCLQTEHLIQ